MVSEIDDENAPKPDRGRRQSKPVTAERLHKSALFYLERYASSSENLRRVLMRKVDRAARDHPVDRDQAAQWVDALIARFQDAGLLDDRAYTQSKVSSLLRRGNSTRAIRTKLSAKGVPPSLIDEALGEAVGDLPTDAPDLAAAVAYVRRRRLGPYRAADRDAYRQKDLAALGRQGFSYDVARRVLEAEDPDALEAFLPD